MCEPVFPKDEPNYIRFFCGNPEFKEDLKKTEEKRIALYKAVVTLIRAYANVANEMPKIGYSETETAKIKAEVQYYSDLRDTIKQASGDYIDLKRFEPGMRQLMDMYLNANSSKKISDFENKTLVELIVHLSEPAPQYKGGKSHQAVAETIENNVRKVVNEESQTNPKYFEKMSKLLDELIKQRTEETLDYEAYLAKIKELSEQITNPSGGANYPDSINSRAKQALYDNLENNEALANLLHKTILDNKLDGWRDGGIKEKKLMLAVNLIIQDTDMTLSVMEIIKAQNEY
jgi:type I restriction enzyme R subunit